MIKTFIFGMLIIAISVALLSVKLIFLKNSLPTGIMVKKFLCLHTVLMKFFISLQIL